MVIISIILIIFILIVIYRVINSAKKSTDKSHQKSFHFSIARILLLIGLSSLLVGVIAILLFFTIWSEQLNGPSASYIKNFDAQVVSKDASTTQSYLEQVLSNANIPNQNIKFVASSYADGCYADNDDTYSPWFKDCYGRTVYLYGSSLSAALTEQYLFNKFTALNWQPTIPQVGNSNCFGDTSAQGGYLTANNLAFTPNYLVSSLSGGCTRALPELTGDTVPLYISDQLGSYQGVSYSSLTHSFNLSEELSELKDANESSYVMISVEKQYFNQRVGKYSTFE